MSHTWARGFSPELEVSLVIECPHPLDARFPSVKDAVTELL